MQTLHATYVCTKHLRGRVSGVTLGHERDWAEYYGGTENVKRSYRKLVLKRMKNKAYRLGFDHPKAVY